MFKEKTNSIRQASLLQCWQIFCDIPPTLWHYCKLHCCSTWNGAAVTLRWFLYTCFSRFPRKHRMEESPLTSGHSLGWGVGEWSSVVFSFLLHNSLCPLSRKSYVLFCNSVGCQVNFQCPFILNYYFLLLYPHSDWLTPRLNESFWAKGLP